MVNKILISILTIAMLCACNSSDDVPMPKDQLFTATSPDNSCEAVIYKTEISDFNIIGSYYRDFLALRYPESELILRRELTDGCGHYEGGVLGIRWLSNHEILVERAIADHREDIIYDTTAHAWYAFQEKQSPTPENTPIGDPDCPWDTALRVIGKEITAPKLVKKVEPKTPEDLLMRYALYIYYVVITDDGNVCGIKLIKEPDDYYPEYEKAITDALMQWKFEPGLKDGHPVDCIMTITMHPHRR